MTEEPLRSILIAGVGNAWLRDEGFGGEVARRLADRSLRFGSRLRRRAAEDVASVCSLITSFVIPCEISRSRSFLLSKQCFRISLKNGAGRQHPRFAARHPR